MRTITFGSTAAEVVAHPPRPAMTPFEKALLVHALMTPGSSTMGAGLGKIRREVSSGVHDDALDPAVLERTWRDIMALGVRDMPAPVELVRLLIETLSFRLGNVGHNLSWEHIGVKRGTGRAYLRTVSNPVNWPVWLTLRNEALADERLDRLGYPVATSRDGTLGRTRGSHRR